MLRRNEPAAVLSCPEQGGKARGRIKPRPAQPVDRAVAADQSCRLAVADQRIVFDSERHCYSLAEIPLLLASVSNKIESKNTLVIAGSLQNLPIPQCASAISVTAPPIFPHPPPRKLRPPLY